MLLYLRIAKLILPKTVMSKTTSPQATIGHSLVNLSASRLFSGIQTVIVTTNSCANLYGKSHNLKKKKKKSWKITIEHRMCN